MVYQQISKSNSFELIRKSYSANKKNNVKKNVYIKTILIRRTIKEKSFIIVSYYLKIMCQCFCRQTWYKKYTIVVRT